MKIRVAIVDDHPMLLKGMQGILGCVGHIEVTGAYLNGRELLEGLKEQVPDVLLLDIQMSGQSGEDLAVILQEKYPGLKILAFTNQEQTYYIRAMISSGVMGYVLKTCDEETLLEAIDAVHSGSPYFDPMIRGQASQIMHSPQAPLLTRREREILQLISENYSSKEIGERLCMGKRTVDNYRIALLLKMDVKNSAGLVKKAVDLGIIK